MTACEHPEYEGYWYRVREDGEETQEYVTLRGTAVQDCLEELLDQATAMLMLEPTLWVVDCTRCSATVLGGPV